MNQTLDPFLLSRRQVLAGAAALSAAPFISGRATAAPTTPISFVGWQYQPQIVEENVKIFSELYDENVTYELVTGDYHPLVETKLTGGQKIDMLYAEEDRSLAGTPPNGRATSRVWQGCPRSRRGMFPVSVESLSLPDGKFAGMPYYAGHNSFIYNEEHLTKAGIQVPEELGRAAGGLPQAKEGRAFRTLRTIPPGDRNGLSFRGACSRAGIRRAPRYSTPKATSSTNRRCARSSSSQTALSRKARSPKTS